MSIVQWLKCIITRSHDWKFLNNVYGDQILITHGNRSIWLCSKCGAYQFRRELYRGYLKNGD